MHGNGSRKVSEMTVTFSEAVQGGFCLQELAACAQMLPLWLPMVISTTLPPGASTICGTESPLMRVPGGPSQM